MVIFVSRSRIVKILTRLADGNQLQEKFLKLHIAPFLIQNIINSGFAIYLSGNGMVTPMSEMS